MDMTVSITLLLMGHTFNVNAGESPLGSVCDDSHCKADACVNRTCPKGCEDGYYGSSCEYTCSIGCLQHRCADSGKGIGICTDGCIPGYWGQTCKSVCPEACEECSRKTGENCTSCPEFYYSNICEQSCRASCPYTGCDMDGNCKQNKIACSNGKFGHKCLKGCGTGCQYDTCNRTSGICIHGCKQGYFGEKCESTCNPNCKNQMCGINGDCGQGCETGFYGEDCDFHCGVNCRQLFCDHDTGDCTNGCSEGYHGAQCNMSCPPGCFACSRKTGECLEVYDTYATSTTINPDGGNGTISNLSETNPTGYYVLASVGIFMLCGTVTVILIKRHWNISHSKNHRNDLRRLPDPPLALYQFEYDEINEDEMDRSNQRINVSDSESHRQEVESTTLSYYKPKESSEKIETNCLNVEDTGTCTIGCQAAPMLIPQNEAADKFQCENGKYLGMTKRENSKYLLPVRSESDVHSVQT